jgi:hypothetical protein
VNVKKRMNAFTLLLIFLLKTTNLNNKAFNKKKGNKQ